MFSVPAMAGPPEKRLAQGVSGLANGLHRGLGVRHRSCIWRLCPSLAIDAAMMAEPGIRE